MHYLKATVFVILRSMEEGNFSRYKILDELGTGGMAKVYRAHDPEFDREVALKILREDLLDDTHVRERFEREIQIIAKLELEGIVPVYDMGRTMQDHLFFVMRLMTGGTLSQRMQNGPLSTDQIIHILQRIAPALDKAHKLGIVHRDLKPANILFDQENHAFISDFGIAKSINAGATSPLTDGGVIMGTPRYMSPEQAWGETVDARSDIYSLGVIVFEMLIGKNKFDSITPRQLAYRESAYKLPSLLESNPDLPPGIQPIIERVLARERDQRYNTATEFADALVAVLSEPSPQTLNTPHKTSQPNARLLMISGFIILALVIFAFWKYSKFAPPVPPLTQTISVKITPSITATLPTPTVTQPPTATITATVIPLLTIGGADKIALTSNNEIYLMNIDGSDIESLTHTETPKFDLQWLPDGNELLYVEGICVYTIDVRTSQKEPQQRACFNDPKFRGFRVSPSGKRVAISIADRLLVLPFDLQTLSQVSSAFEIQKLDNLCLDYSDVTVKGALWSVNGRRLAIRYQSVVNGRIGDTIRVIEGNWDRCQEVSVLVWDDFPADHFVPNGYLKYPLLPSYHWDGNQQFLVNSFIRNDNYGDLYIYDMSTGIARNISPIDRSCCYGSAAFSPDGKYILLIFQDRRIAPKNESKLYYIPIEEIGTTASGTIARFTPYPLPGVFFEDKDENIQLALRPSKP